jgi:hypothetical protein
VTQESILWGLVAVLALATVVLGLTVYRLRQRASVVEESARTDTETLHARLAELEQRLAPSAPVESAEFVITDLHEPGTLPAERAAAAPPARIEGRLFADLVLRETVVKAASLAYGVGRALSPESRFRMRYEMSREMKLSRKERRQELREARRYLQSRRRAEAAARAAEDAA